MWGAILEKAFAKLHGNYEHLIGGDPREASRSLTGSPSLQYVHTKPDIDVDFIWQELIKHDTNNEMMFLQTPTIEGSEVNDCGLQTGHAYVVLEAKELSNGAKVVKMRNPWAQERYSCDYSDDSNKWTNRLREEAGATDIAVNEGIFFMTVDDYFEQGQVTVISYDTTDWYHSYFLKLDDETDSPGSWSWCGATCTRHTLEVTSDAAQPVFVTAHTWDARSYPDECRAENKAHSIYLEGDRNIALFKEGTTQLLPIDFKPGETKKFIVEWDWARENITPDWSLTAWAEKGDVTVKHAAGLTTDTLPFVERRAAEETVSASNSKGTA